MLALEQARSQITEGHLRRLEEANADLAWALEDHDARALSADDAFHEVRVDAAGNRALADVLGQVKLKSRRVELAYFGQEACGERSWATTRRWSRPCAPASGTGPLPCCAGTGGAAWSAWSRSRTPGRDADEGRHPSCDSPPTPVLGNSH